MTVLTVLQHNTKCCTSTILWGERLDKMRETETPQTRLPVNLDCTAEPYQHYIIAPGCCCSQFIPSQAPNVGLAFIGPENYTYRSIYPSIYLSIYLQKARSVCRVEFVESPLFRRSFIVFHITHITVLCPQTRSNAQPFFLTTSLVDALIYFLFNTSLCAPKGICYLWLVQGHGLV
jgi:hypothetical protein